jgi:hypothetical protein
VIPFSKGMLTMESTKVLNIRNLRWIHVGKGAAFDQSDKLAEGFHKKVISKN